MSGKKKNPYEDSHKSLPALMNLLALQTYNKFLLGQAFSLENFIHMMKYAAKIAYIFFMYHIFYLKNFFWENTLFYFDFILFLQKTKKSLK